MFKPFYSGDEVSHPKYTIRLLLDKVESPSLVRPHKLKAYSHFTLGCHSKDYTPQINESFNLLADIWKKPISFDASEVVNLGSEDDPLWAIKLDFGFEEKELRELLGSLFDDLMCHERNGILYKWNPKINENKKVPHVTIGRNHEDQQFANSLVGCKFIFNQMDYKQVGPHDPHISKALASSKLESSVGLRS